MQYKSMGVRTDENKKNNIFSMSARSNRYIL